MADIIELLFPLGGIDVAGPYSKQRPLTTPLAVNVRGDDIFLSRGRGGSRPGINKFITEQVPEGPELLQFLGQVVVHDGDYLLTAFEDFNPDFITDPTTGDRNPGRDIPPNGSGVPQSRNRPRTVRRRIALVPSVASQVQGSNVTLTLTLTDRPGGAVVASQPVTLMTLPPGQDGDGDTGTTDGSGQVTWVVNEATFEGPVLYFGVHEFEL